MPESPPINRCHLGSCIRQSFLWVRHYFRRPLFLKLFSVSPNGIVPSHQCLGMDETLKSLSSRLESFPHSSAGKKSTCNAGDPGLIPGLGRSTGEGIRYPSQFLGFNCGSAGKESTCNVGDLGSIPGLGRFPGERERLLHFSILAWRIPWTV